MVHIDQTGPSIDSAEGPESPHEDLSAIHWAGQQANCLSRQTDKYNDPALERAPSLGRVFYHEVPKYIQGQGFEGG